MLFRFKGTNPSFIPTFGFQLHKDQIKGLSVSNIIKEIELYHILQKKVHSLKIDGKKPISVDYFAITNPDAILTRETSGLIYSTIDFRAKPSLGYTNPTNEFITEKDNNLMKIWKKTTLIKPKNIEKIHKVDKLNNNVKKYFQNKIKKEGKKWKK